jgi:site-specific DNA-methyltransferase (adenine-specific)
MKEVEDGSVHLVVTSPPYWQLKDYGHPGQIGFHQSYEEYVNDLNMVWQECFRTLYAGCRACINVGDQFSRAIHYGRYKLVSIQSEVIRFCETLGMDYMGTIVWQKVTTTKTTGGAAIMGSYPYPRNGMIKVDYEHILLFRKQGAPPKPNEKDKIASAMSLEEWNSWFSGHWKIPGARQNGHGAVFPDEVPRRLIRMFSFPGETVLDPFAGSGTTLAVAAQLGRSSIGYEINPEFIELAQLKLASMNAAFELGKPASDPAEIDRRGKLLPYVFKDPHAFDRAETKLTDRSETQARGRSR